MCQLGREPRPRLGRLPGRKGGQRRRYVVQFCAQVLEEFDFFVSDVRQILSLKQSFSFLLERARRTIEISLM
jgi:hypothetical protein